jgi:uncharacterized protein
MPILVNVRRLERDSMQLAGELPVEELDLAGVDELIRVESPLRYDLEAQKLENSVLAQGKLELDLVCECARCLKPFAYRIELPAWTCLLPLEGEEKTPVTNDRVDLTPCVREDILLEFPQHPLCKRDCRGLPKRSAPKAKITGGAGQTKDVSSAWTALNKLKFK